MMDLTQRAHIFSAFDALKGFRELLKEKERIIVPKRILSEDDLEVLNRKIHEVKLGMILTVVYFDNGDYVKFTGRVAKVKLDEQYVQIVKKKINIKDIVDLQADEFDSYEI